MGKSHFLYKQRFVENDQNILIDHEQGLSLGAGLKYQIPRGPMLIIDYVLMDFGIFTSVSGYSINVSF